MREAITGRTLEDLLKEREVLSSKLQEDVARPIIFNAKSATCYQPYVKGFVMMSNSVYNGWRFEDVWLDR